MNYKNNFQIYFTSKYLLEILNINNLGHIHYDFDPYCFEIIIHSFATFRLLQLPTNRCLLLFQITPSDWYFTAEDMSENLSYSGKLYCQVQTNPKPRPAPSLPSQSCSQQKGKVLGSPNVSCPCMHQHRKNQATFGKRRIQ